MKIIGKLFKIFAAGLAAVIILSVLCSAYYILPVHSDNPAGNTDYVWKPGALWVKMNEGISAGRFDGNGYNNPDTVENPDVIVLGSSHTEALNVFPGQNFVYLLSESLKDKYTVYNMGISEHTFYKICQNLPANLEMNERPPQIVILETGTTFISEEIAGRIVSGTVEKKPSYSNGIIGFLQRVPFFRLAYLQIDWGLTELFIPELKGKSSESIDEANRAASEIKEKTVSTGAYEKVFSYLSDLERRYGSRIIIAYHPTGKLMPDGSLAFESTLSDRAMAETAEKYGIEFVNMAQPFEDMYKNGRHVVHGFANGKLEDGHLNAYGHKAMADKLEEVIIRGEGK